ncbi:NAD(P)/FAD-dependent oxidoreductase [Krasilnikovia sp. MM14-A1004]|uniref:NAD(P)/FAD-dependent oxidoreductase n=1 Tax=Krasilnikovia sp. MM14-A1004 TaxID=3373541 RepID=UPI00399C772D
MTETKPSRFDVVIVGAGAAGLTAAVMLGRSKQRILVVSLPRRRNSSALAVRNVPYADGLPPDEIYAKMELDAAGAGVEFCWDEVTSVQAGDDEVTVATRGNGTFVAARLLLATGRRDEIPHWLPDGVWGRTVFECPYCHTFENSGKTFAVVGRTDNTTWLARLAQVHAGRMTVLVGDPQVLQQPDRARDLLVADGAEVFADEVTSAVVGPAGELRLATKAGREVVVDVVLLAEVAQPDQRFTGMLGLDLMDNGHPRIDTYGRTSHPRVYSAGNALGSPHYMWTGAASSGLNAAKSIWEDVMTK